MLIYAQDRKSVLDAKLLQIAKNIGGPKDKKYFIMASGSSTLGTVCVAGFPDEKAAADALEKVFKAFEDGAKAYKFD